METVNMTTGPNTTEETRPRRLSDMEPEEVRALPAPALAIWKEETRQGEEDFRFMMLFVDRLYKPVRKYFKAERAVWMAEHGGGDRAAGRRCDDHLYEVFGLLLELAEEFRADPEFEARFRHYVTFYRAQQGERRHAEDADQKAGAGGPETEKAPEPLRPAA